MNNSFVKSILASLSLKFDETIEVISVTSVLGGDINETYKLETSKGVYFVKINDGTKYPEMFAKEANGLNALAQTKMIKIPSVIHFENSFLLLEWIEHGDKKQGFWNVFGSNLAKLHQVTNDRFGFEEDNYIGSLIQSNSWQNTWTDFFVLQRLEPQLKLARENNLLDASIAKSFDRLFHKLEILFPKEAPALIHGDLWSGNFMVSTDGSPVIMDPAVYYGHREMDLAMTQLFGGFDSKMYFSYNEQFPLEQGWEERVPLCNIYPLLVHVNLFGGSYVNQVEQVLGRFV